MSRLLRRLLVVEAAVVGFAYLAVWGTGFELGLAVLLGTVALCTVVAVETLRDRLRRQHNAPRPRRTRFTYFRRGSSYPGYRHTDSSGEDVQREREFRHRLDEIARTEAELRDAFRRPPKTKDEEERFIGHLVWVLMPLAAITTVIALVW